MANKEQTIQDLKRNISYMSKERREAKIALEKAANLVNFDTRLKNINDCQTIIEQTGIKIKPLFKFKVLSFYLVNENDYSFYQAYCDPKDYSELMEHETQIMINDHTFAWALTRNRPIIVSSSTGENNIILHAIATPHRTRGMFVGILNQDRSQISDYCFYLLTLVLLSCSNFLEGFELYKHIRSMNRELEERVKERTAKLKETNALLKKEITERQLVENELRLSEEKYRTIFENTGTATAIVEEDTTISLVNKEFEHLAGYSREEIEWKKSWKDFAHQEDLKFMEEYHYLRRKGQDSAPKKYEFRFIDKDYFLKHVSVNIAVIPGTKKSVASLLDISDRKVAEKQLRFFSFHDPLTGLYNRTYFEQEMKRLESARFSSIGIIICDLDGLKQVNDQFGHKAGDILIKKAGSLLKKAFRESDMVARIGGDEFAVLLPNSDKKELQNAYQRIKKAILKHNEKNPKLPIHLSIGYSIHDWNSPVNMNNLFKDADNAMYQEKVHNREQKLSNNIQAIIQLLEDKDITNSQRETIKDLIQKMGYAPDLPD